MFSPLLWAACVVLCFGGGFAGFICAQSYEAHISRTVAVRTDYTHVGMLQFAALGLGAVLPPGLVMMAVHLARRAAAAAGRHLGQQQQQQQQQQCALYDGAAKHHHHHHAGATGCRVAPAALGTPRTSPGSSTATSTIPSDDGAPAQLPSLSGGDRLPHASAAAASNAPGTNPAGAGKDGGEGGNSRSRAQPHDGECRTPLTPDPFIRHGRPELAALLEEIARTGGGLALAQAAPRQQRPRSSRSPLVVSVEARPPETPAASDLGGVDLDATDGHLATKGQIQNLTLDQYQDLDADLDVDLLDPSTLRVAVFVSGPVRLVGAVEELCAVLNGPWGRPGRAYLEAHPLTHEL